MGGRGGRRGSERQINNTHVNSKQILFHGLTLQQICSLARLPSECQLLQKGGEGVGGSGGRGREWEGGEGGEGVGSRSIIHM